MSNLVELMLTGKLIMLNADEEIGFNIITMAR